MTEEIEKEFSQVMPIVFLWAYKHGIDVELRRIFSWGTDGYVALRFRKDDKFYERPFIYLVDISTRLEDEWREVALALLVEPMDLSGVKK